MIYAASVSRYPGRRCQGRILVHRDVHFWRIITSGMHGSQTDCESWPGRGSSGRREAAEAGSTAIKIIGGYVFYRRERCRLEVPCGVRDIAIASTRTYVIVVQSLRPQLGIGNGEVFCMTASCSHLVFYL